MKRLPKTVTILGQKIPVKTLSSKDILKLYPDFQQAPQGLWDSCNEVIVINKDFPLKSQIYTYFHEIYHAAATFTGLDLIIDPSIQEIMVQTFATIMRDALNQAQNG